MVRHPTQTAALVAATLLVAVPARAQDWTGLFSAVEWTSDYRYQGISSTDRRPALQGYVHLQRSDGLYAGVFASEVHYYDGGPRLEIDTYAGKHFELAGGRTEFTAEAMYTTFPYNRTPGPTFDFLQVKGAVQRREGPWTLIGTVAATPQASYGAGEAWLAQGEADYALTPRLSLKAQAGRRWVHRGADRTFWSVGSSFAAGGTARQPRAVFGLRYEDTNLSPAGCGFNPRICGPEVVASVTVNLPAKIWMGAR